MAQALAAKDEEQPDFEQFDAFLLHDILQEATKDLRVFAEDVGSRFLADKIGRRASTVHNQLSGEDPEKHPAFDVALALAAHHKTYRRRLRALLDRIEGARDLDDTQIVNEVERFADGLGQRDAKALRVLLSRRKRGSR